MIQDNKIHSYIFLAVAYLYISFVCFENFIPLENFSLI